MKTKHAIITVELNVECPNPDCGNVFDLFEMQQLTEEGILFDIVMPSDKQWGCKDLQKELDNNRLEIRCPECKTKIEIGEVEW